MALAPKSVQEMERAVSAADSALIREQLARLLAHPLFANSKRYPALLAYTVEQTLLGNAAELKERSIGIEVFGRSPSYDANADPVVRITAGEVRKRLSQYYYDSTHDGEWLSSCPIGSYVPLFHAPEPLRSRSPEPITGIAWQRRPPRLQPPPAASTAPMDSRLRWLVAARFWSSLSGAVGLGIGLRSPASRRPSRLPSQH